MGDDDLRVEHRWGQRETLIIQFVPGSIETNSDNTRVTATYMVMPPGNSWDVLDFGEYAVLSAAGGVSSSGSTLSTRGETLGSFRVQIAAPDVLYVSRYDDPLAAAGDLSLRQALAIANSQPQRSYTIILDTGRYTLDLPYAPDPTYAFAAGSQAACWTDITPPIWSNAEAGDLDVLGNVTILGSDAQSTIIDAQGLDRAIKLHNGATLTLKRIAIKNGQTPGGQGGGGILSAGNLTLDQVLISDNSVSNSNSQLGRGGAVALWDGQASISQSRMTANTAPVGAGIFACGPASFTVSQSTIDNNRGSGITSYSQANSTVISSTVANNFGDAITSQARDYAGSSGSGFAPSISRDGSRIVFLSSSSDLVHGDTNSSTDGFVYDVANRNIERISRSTSGQQANTHTDSLAISGDGHKVALATLASNLTSGDNSFTNDVFVRDTVAGVTSLVSTTGSTLRAVRGQMAMSGDGRLVAYQQAITNDPFNTWAVYIADGSTGQVERVSLQLAEGGVANIGFLNHLALSADGRYLVIGASQSGTVNGRFHELYLFDRVARSLRGLPVRPSGSQVNGSLYSASISDDGRFIAFASDDSNLISGDTNGVADIFVYDQQTATTERISVSGTSAQANQASAQPSINSNGRFIAFSSSADNLVAGDTNGRADVFVVDRVTREVVLVSRATVAQESNGDSTWPSISGDGQRIAFSSTANNLVASHPNHRPPVSTNTQVFVADRLTNTIQGVSSFTTTSTLQVNSSTLAFNSGRATISGSVTIGNSLMAGNITELDFGNRTFSLGFNIYASSSGAATIATTDIRNSDGATRLSELTSLDGQPPGYQLLEGNPAINAGAPSAAASLDQWQRPRTVPDIGALEAVTGSLSGYVFVDLNSDGTREISEPGLSDQQVFLDQNGDGIWQATEPTTRTSTNTDVHGAGFYRFEHLSPTEHTVRLVVPNQWSVTAPEIVRVGQGNIQSNGSSAQALFGASGQTVAFVSTASNLVSGDTAAANIFIFSRATNAIEKVPIEGANLKLLGLLGAQDQWVLLRNDTGVYLYDRLTQAVQLVSVSNSGQPANAHSDWGAASADGRWIVYSSFASNLVSGDNDTSADIFLFDRQSQTVVSITRQANGVQGNKDSEWPVISEDGSTIVFVSDATNLVPGDTNGVSDIFVYTTQTQTLRRVSLGSNGAQSNGFSYPPKLSGNGRYVLFQSFADNLVAGDSNTASDLFVVDLLTSSIERLDIPFKSTAQAFNYAASISFDGQYVTFEASSTNLNSNQANPQRNVFVYDRFWSASSGTPRLALITTASAVVANNGSANGHSGEATFSSDGRWLTFQSLASNLVPNDTNALADIFIASNPFEIASQSAALRVGQQLTDIDYALTPQPGVLAGVLFNDLGEDLTFDLGDPGLAGWVVYLDNNFNGRRDVGEPSTLSDADGAYRFEAVPTQREQGLAVEAPSNWQQFAPQSVTTRLFLPAGGQSLQRNFAFRAKPTTGQSENSSVEGRVFQRLESRWYSTSGEQALANVEVYLDLVENGVRDATEPRKLTDSQGNYRFSNLRAGNYAVRASLDEATLLTSPLGNSFQQQSITISGRSTAINTPQDLVLSDLDGVNGPDVSVAFFYGNALVILLNNGRGQFATTINSRLPEGDTGPQALAAAQLNGREGTDLIVANSSSGTISILLDFQGQDFRQKSSLVVSRDTTLRSARLADLDNDGDQDLIAITGDTTTASQVHTFFNNGNAQFTRGGTFSASGKLPVALVTSDFNRDGRIDVAVANLGLGGSGANIAVLLGTADNRFATASTYNQGVASTDIEAADLNGDSWPDLVSTNYALNTASILQGSSSGTFNLPALPISVPDGPFHLKLNDIDGDSDADILVSDLKSTKVSLIRNQQHRAGNNQMAFEPAENYALGTFTPGSRVAFDLRDLDNDGTLDIALTNSSSTTVKILSNRIIAGANRVPLSGTNSVMAQNFGMQSQILLPGVQSIVGPTQLPEDSGPRSLTLVGITKGLVRTSQLRVTASSSQPALVALQQQILTSSSNLIFDIAPQPDASGTVVIVFEIRDPGADQLMDTADDGFITRDHTITISPVNDAPTFTLAGNQVITVGSNLRTVDGFASDFRPGGGADEATQTIAEYLVSNDRTDLFLVQPAIDNLGQLRYQPRATTGLATVTVQVRDSGGTLGGGVDRSVAQSFQILVTDKADGEIDFGDAPGSYSVTIAGGGARHRIDGLFLGSAVDAESNGQPSSNADGDDVAFDDEDGIQFILPPLALDSQPTMSSIMATVKVVAVLMQSWMHGSISIAMAIGMGLVRRSCPQLL